VPTRLDIELTSISGDGSWTWRAAGAREPKGVLDGSILPAGAAVGDQLRAETEQNVEGIRVLSIVPAKQRAERNDLLELLPSSDFQPVTQQRVGRDRQDSGRTRPRRNRDDRPRDDSEAEGDRPRRDRGRRGEGGGGSERRGGPRREDDAQGRDDRSRQRHRPHRPHFTPPPELPQRPRPKRLRPGKEHLGAVLESLPEEQRAVGELALQGMAAVRQRLREDNARLKAAGKPEMPEATVLRMAEDLLPQLRVAEWLDRAEAAKRQLAHLDLRDLRSVVAASDDPLVARDESTRALASELKSALTAKQDEEFNLWLGDVEAAVDVGRVVRALRLSAEPPKAGVPFPAALGSKLGSATVAALSTEDPPERWITVLEAAAFSPIRTLVIPTAAPAQRTADLVATVTRLGPLLPQVAALFEIEIPDKAPAPKPLRPMPRKKEAARKPAAAAKAGPRDAKPEAAAAEQAAPTEPAVAEAEAPVQAVAAADAVEAAPPDAQAAGAETGNGGDLGVSDGAAIEDAAAEARAAPVEPASDVAVAEAESAVSPEVVTDAVEAAPKDEQAADAETADGGDLGESVEPAIEDPAATAEPGASAEAAPELAVAELEAPVDAEAAAEAVEPASQDEQAADVETAVDGDPEVPAEPDAAALADAAAAERGDE
jgi:hypothetical protein